MNKVNYLNIQDDKTNREIAMLKKKIQKLENVAKSKKWDQQVLKKSKLINYLDCLEKRKKFQMERQEAFKRKEDIKTKLLTEKKVILRRLRHIQRNFQ